MRPIFVRKLSKSEKAELKKLFESTNTRLHKRVRVVWLSAIKRLKAPEIAEVVDLHLNKVRKYIRQFNKKGIAGLYQKPSSGRPREIKERQRNKIIKLLKTKPKELGLAWSSWNLRGLCAIAIKMKIVKTISPEYMRRVIAREGYSYKRSKRWIICN